MIFRRGFTPLKIYKASHLKTQIAAKTLCWQWLRLLTPSLKQVVPLPSVLRLLRRRARQSRALQLLRKPARPFHVFGVGCKQNRYIKMILIYLFICLDVFLFHVYKETWTFDIRITVYIYMYVYIYTYYIYIFFIYRFQGVKGTLLIFIGNGELEGFRNSCKKAYIPRHGMYFQFISVFPPLVF